MDEDRTPLGELIGASSGHDDEAGQVATAAVMAMDRFLVSPRYELWPVRGAIDQAQQLPPGSTVPVACFAAQGLAPTIDLAVELAAAGHRPVPHVAARIVTDRAMLQDVVERLDAAGIEALFVIAGDVPDPLGPYTSAVDLLRELVDLDGGALRRSVGVAGYPEGHPHIEDDELWDALAAKQELGAAFVVTQMCFDAEAILTWITATRDRGIELPVHVGLPGSAERRHLVTIAGQTGVGASLRFLSGHTGLAARLFRPGGFSPRHLVESLRPHLGTPGGPAGFNIFTLNRIDRLARVLAD
jgi:methylenetetrahydrofolate reductase (NADPH)